MDLNQFCKNWLSAWTGNRPIILREFYTENAFYRDPAKPNGIQGKELLPYFEKLLRLNPSWIWEVSEILPTSSGFCLKWKASIPVGKKTVQETGMDIVELENGKIKRNEVYFDRAALFEAMSKTPRTTALDHVRMRPMTKEEFEVYLAQFRDRLLKDGMKACRVSEAEAKSIVEKDLAHINRDGFETKNNYWFTLLNDESKNIGSLWLSIKGEGEKQTPYLGDLMIAPDFRGRGIAKQALSLLETELPGN